MQAGLCSRASRRSVLAQPEVSSVLVIVADALVQKQVQVPLIDLDYQCFAGSCGLGARRSPRDTVAFDMSKPGLR